MVEQLKSVPACQLMVSDEQYRAVGHVALQWANLEAEMDREILWLNKQNAKPVKLGGKFEDRAAGWRRMANITYEGHPQLTDAVEAIANKAVAIKRERDKLIHCNMSEGWVFRIYRGKVIDISDAGTAPHIEDLACRISNISAELMQHFGRLARVFHNPL